MPDTSLKTIVKLAIEKVKKIPGTYEDNFWNTVLLTLQSVYFPLLEDLKSADENSRARGSLLIRYTMSPIALQLIFIAPQGERPYFSLFHQFCQDYSLYLEGDYGQDDVMTFERLGKRLRQLKKEIEGQVGFPDHPNWVYLNSLIDAVLNGQDPPWVS